MIKKSLLLPALFFLTAAGAFAQQKVVADKIVGIVGDKIILKSELGIAIQDMIRNNNGQEVKGVDECSILDNMLIQKALVLQAEKDSLPVSEEEVEAEVEQRIRYFINMYGGKEAFEQIAQRTVYQAKQDFLIPIREQRLATAMRNKIVEDIKITPQEVKEYFEKMKKNNLRFYESEMQLSQLVLYPKASRDIERLSIDELNEYKRQVESGQKKFDVLARLYSDDPGSKEKGGEIALSRSDSKMWDPVFFATAFRLKEGQVSPVIKSKFGYHIIQMVSRSGDDAIVRHILKIPPITEPEIAEVSTMLDSVRNLLVAGTMGFGEAIARFSADNPKWSTDDISKSTAGQVMGKDGSTFLTISEMDKDMVLLLKNSNLKPGEYSKPTSFTDERGKKGVRIVLMVSKSEPHTENLKDDYNRVAQRALDEKKSAALEKWFGTKIPTFYIMIDGDYKTCSNLSKWQTGATAGN
ncbi:peptidylprolyl isomerase [Flavitalea sp. BT771]|uniref:peptidylprolyl isomerase n=1 Tax=Flavitalea sp. BT771 TaxID=3063329 RepID=UPI0026E35722|nr:peptidylprolyl isomerase [Flavitalea sp. BT771]MDO6433546.1 peptidylprolyl isomerase [Flavitalea sp. BT771]MDV6222549.1 peptidylprolyl isomerase [Flavitalea sp. BT771]